MAIIFDNIPSTKPSGKIEVEPGKYTAKVFKAEMQTGKASGNDFLSVSFKLDKGGFVNEAFTDNDKPFNQWKIGRLCKACGVSLEGEFQLKDLIKVIRGKNVILDVTMNDRGYPSVDYSSDNDGMYPVEEESVSTAEIEAAVEDTDF